MQAVRGAGLGFQDRGWGFELGFRAGRVFLRFRVLASATLYDGKERDKVPGCRLPEVGAHA